MTTTAATGTNGTYQDIPIGLIDPSGLNPRKHFVPAEDKELEDSVRAEGVMEPIVVRRHPTKPGRFQVVAGERRFRAATAVGVPELPAMVRDVDDAKLLDLALTENIQRRSMHPLDTAAAFAQRLEMDTTCTPEAIATTLGLSKRYVVDMLRLKNLSKTARAGVEKGDISVSHAIILAKLDPKLQDQAIDDCTDHVFDFDASDRRPVLRPVSALKEWVADNVRLDPKAPDTAEEFPELVAEVAAAEARGATVVILSDYRTPWQHKAKPDDPLFAERWAECKKSEKAALLGIFVDGRRRGQKIYFKPVAAAAKPANSAPSQSRSSEEKQRREAQRKRDEAAKLARQEQEKHWKTLKPKALDAVVDHVRRMPLKALLAVMAKRHHCKPTETAEALLRAMAAKDATVSDYNLDALGYSSTAFGFDVKKWFKTEAAALKAAAKASPAKTAKKAKGAKK
ncbi:MAG: ParB/RepB/Spo0J family partition protein [Acidobacteriota bacterium]|nr:ParB/RepB/Spo0J family partition protein [Acidobacteriota bacterium]